MKKPPRPRRENERDTRAPLSLPRVPVAPDRTRPVASPPPAAEEKTPKSKDLPREAARPGDVLRRPVGSGAAARVLGPSTDAPTASLEERRHEKRDAQRRLKIRRLLGVVLALLIAGTLVGCIYFSPLFALDKTQVHVTGATEEQVPRAQIMETLGDAVGTPVLRIDTDAVELSLEKITMVKEATVTRRWPAGLDIALVPRVPVVNEAVDGQWRYLDDEGVTLSLRDTPLEGAPRCVLPSDASRATAVKDLLGVWKVLTPEVRSRVQELSWQAHTIRFTLTGGQQVVWGESVDAELKTRVLSTLLAQREAKIYDVSAPARPVTS